MKKILILVITATLLLSVTACSDNTPEDSLSSVIPETEDHSSATPSETEREAVEAPETPETNTAINDNEHSDVRITLDFNRAGTSASNQYAVWVENKDGELVKTLFVTRFTASGGYLQREDCMPTWVAKANPQEADPEGIDSITGATPNTGSQSHVWDGTNDAGELLPDGNYTICVEGTLYWSSIVLFSGNVQLGGGVTDTKIELEASYTESTETNRDMIVNVQAEYIRRG